VATQTYLDTVPPEKRARSDAYFEGGYWVGFALFTFAFALPLGDYRKLHPGSLEEMIFFDHPSGYTRISTAMRWKAQQADTQTDSRSEEAAVRAARTIQNRAIAAHDLDAIAAIWSIDYVGVSSANVRVLGRDGKREDFAKQFAARPDVVYVRTPTSITVNTARASVG
jgi:hypothetical protein